MWHVPTVRCNSASLAEAVCVGSCGLQAAPSFRNCSSGRTRRWASGHSAASQVCGSSLAALNSPLPLLGGDKFVVFGIVFKLSKDTDVHKGAGQRPYYM